MDGKVFVILIIAISTFGWIISSWIRAKHGYPLEGEWGGTTEHPDSNRNMAALESENQRLNKQVSRLEERLAVLERIATDPAERTAREIEQLR